ncbi:MAG TPA: MotA/TolQ/ExbB proton channel family protein [Chthoniobacterales bacterium]|nr:MotA/TolQ/ExbB proton channel family protein [Chthoniobacterales bacterium]
MNVPIAAALQSITGFFAAGGIFMIPLVIISIMATTVMLLRGFALREQTVMPAAIGEEVARLEPGDELNPLSEILHDNPSPLSRILLILMRNLSWPRTDNAEAIQTQARHETARLEQGMVLLEITAGIGPLIGLLGTLSGLVGMFTNIGGDGDAMVIAHGISEALNTTIVGLSVAVPSLVAHNYFMRKIEVMAVEMEAVAAELLAKCYPSPDQQPSIHSLE